jgi:hypothetical protein
MVAAANANIAHLVSPDRDDRESEVESHIRRALQNLPLGTLYWGSRDSPINPEELEERTYFIGNLRFVIEPEQDGNKTLGIWFPKGVATVSYSSDRTVFTYLSRTFEIVHKDIPFHRDFKDIL